MMVTPELIAESLQGLPYPAAKQDILTHALTHGASERVMHVLYQLPEDEYRSEADIWDTIQQHL